MDNTQIVYEFFYHVVYNFIYHPCPKHIVQMAVGIFLLIVIPLFYFIERSRKNFYK